MIMAKRQIDLTSERPTVGGVRRAKPAVIRVRPITEYGGRAHYYMDGWPWPVPSVLRHLDGRTWRGVALALLALAAVGYGLARVALAGD
jgi:hypothetical protein